MAKKTNLGKKSFWVFLLVHKLEGYMGHVRNHGVGSKQDSSNSCGCGSGADIKLQPMLDSNICAFVGINLSSTG